ncbi:MAG: cytochrome b N-terminal domain-containing protein [Zoogloeaceae bacterium]|jgi:NAD(P)H-flavin reductase/ferredoxin|nr:cytochrome b N-terminal domain-containing protein [Zoogloeaceae bacterium]
MLKLLHKTMQWFFIRVEGIFNVAFGEKLNPLYHLGTITFWQFWLVAVSGLYLFVFADTGVRDAYASVEAITHDQWWAGGILRSVHRYASDGMIITMLLHMARHFAFDRYRGFRWFSWITGVILIWLMYITGINGFMLVWDKLAQFVTLATAELLDWIPLFKGVVIRNFIFDSHINDRLFSLLAFIHLGAPLVVLMVMWIHVQRVPRAHINPPKAIALWVTFTFLVLSLVKPVVSQGPANLSVEVTQLDFDWFYLAVYPLIYDWRLEYLWGLLIGITVLLFLTPWLPPKRRGSAKAEFEINVHPDEKTVKARFGETILDAGLLGGINLPYECRNGGCGVCKCSVLIGDVDPGIYQSSALSPAERAMGKVLMCCATPLSDIEIEYESQDALARAPVKEYTGVVHKMEKLGHDVMAVTIKLPPDETISFIAGQYINIILDDGERRAFSFSNAPHNAKHVDLQIRLMPGGRFTTHVFEQMKVGDPIRFEGPLGEFTLRESTRPIIFVAGATGFAPVKSMVEDAFYRGLKRPIRLYWGVKQRRDLYMADLPEQWQREHESFKFIPVLSEPSPEDNWTGRTGLVHEAILQDFPSLSGNEIYACGSVRMVEAIFPKLKAQGAEEGMCFSDVFTLSARSMAIQVPEEKQG